MSGPNNQYHDLLTTGEWTRWREDDRRWKEKLEIAIDQLISDNANQNVEIASLKTGNAKAMQKNSAFSAIISTVISGIIGAFK